MFNSTYEPLFTSIVSRSINVVLCIVLLVYVLCNASLGRWVAIKKGYSSIAWFWICFFFGLFGLIALCAAPNKSLERTLREIRAAVFENANITSGREEEILRKNQIIRKTWICHECETINPESASFCKGCGKYR